ncbi:MAG: acyl-CoA thioesterase [Candidatus Cloacimonetes bacterium]|nr:acyl-CoA thioesterase [Candidatus Cloacimonadota bacterium]
MIFEYKKKVYGYECDVYGHLNNAIYLQIYEAARAEALSSMSMPVAKLLEQNVMLYLVKVEIIYKKGVGLEDTVTVKSHVSQNDRLKAIWQQEMHNSSGELCSTATITGVYVSNGKPYRISPELCVFFDKFVEK